MPQKNIIYILIIIATLFSARSVCTSVSAQGKIQSENYQIQLPNFNSGAGIPTSASYKLDTTIGQTAPGLFTSNGYFVKSGFQYIHSLVGFSFSISKIAIPFGALNPQTPKTDSLTLTVTAGGAGGYKVYSQENKPLTNSDASQTIPDTLCDSTCSQTSAAVWTQDTSYGFGFNMSGSDIPTDFVDSTYYRQFADASTSEAAQEIMGGNNVSVAHQANVNFKVNVSGVQPAGMYSNIITFFAVPTY